MRIRTPFVVIVVLALSAAGAIHAQITNPIPAPVEKRGLMVEIRDVVRLPDTRGLRPADQDVSPSGWARVSYVRDLPDGRRFANDSRGLLYELDRNNQPSVYADVAAAFPSAVYNRLESGFIGFDFHPEFARNGLFYTVHGERARGNPAPPDFVPPGFAPADVTHHNVITEWRTTNPAASSFEGTRRELLRVAHVVNNLAHPFGAVEFNPTSKPGAPDYGLLYTSGSDLGFSNGGGPNANNPGQTQRLDSVITAILRFDPRSPAVSGGTKGLGDYTIPAINRFAADGDPGTLGEIYAYGFRNAHRLSWDLTDGTMFASDIGMNHIEEINIVREGGNYGWMRREGYFENGMTRPGGALNQLFPLPADVLEGRQNDGFTYPVAVYDHSDGQAVSGGFAYNGPIAALRGKFVFGDIVRGRLFAADLAAMKKADDGIPRTVAPVEEIQLYVRDPRGNRVYVTLRELIERAMGATMTRADLHIGRSRDGELFITSRQDGVIRMLVPDSGGAPTASTSARAVEDRFTVATLSARPDMTSGGDVLVRASAPAAVPLEQVRVSLNGEDVTSIFRRDESTHTLAGLVSGLKVGPNVLAVAVSGAPRNAPRGNGGARLTVMNHPVAGPIFSGPHEQPFICETGSFTLASGETLGNPLDANCSIERRVDYYYRSTAGGNLKPLPPASTPPDLARTTTLDGAAVPYVVRIETGTINRAIYQLSMLHNPASEPTPDPWVRPAGWNRRLIYTHGGGCVNGWYRQGSTTGGVDDDVMLRQGYAVASASLNVFGNNCNDLLASETMMMVKERFIEAYGPPKFTIGWGCSGGSYQQLQTADNYPGLLDGIIPCRTFPDVAFDTVPVITDARLLNRYFSSPASVRFSEDQQRAVVGFVKLATMANVDKNSAGRIQVLEFCPPALPVALRYDATTNPKGARCDVYDHTVNAYGRDPRTGFARRPLDNTGIQYGLAALNAGSISKEQFLDMNARIGGFDNDGNVVGRRSEGDVAAIRAAYRTGRLTSGGGGLASTPIVDYRNYLDDQEDGDVHLRYHSFALRERLVKANGHADNHVMLVEDERGGTSASPVYREALDRMDRWLMNLSEDASNDPQLVKILRAKPADLTDACWSRDQVPQKIVETQKRDVSTRCGRLYPTASFPREIAGASVAGDIVKCQLKPIEPSDYQVTFTADEMARLERAFPGGVCDWKKPGVEQQKLSGTWLKIGVSGT